MSRRTQERSIGLVMRYRSVGDLMRHHLEESAGVPVAWSVDRAGEAVERCRRRAPTLVITAPTLPDAPAVELTRLLRASQPGARVLLYTSVLNRELVHEMMAVCVNGMVSAASPLPTLLTAIDVVLEGGCFFDSFVEPFMHLPAPERDSLSSREKMVLQLVAEGLSTKEIASELGVSVKTADKFRERIMAKLNLHDAVRLTRYAIRTGICALN